MFEDVRDAVTGIKGYLCPKIVKSVEDTASACYEALTIENVDKAEEIFGKVLLLTAVRVPVLVIVGVPALIAHVVALNFDLTEDAPKPVIAESKVEEITEQPKVEYTNHSYTYRSSYYDESYYTPYTPPVSTQESEKPKTAKKPKATYSPLFDDSEKPSRTGMCSNCGAPRRKFARRYYASLCGTCRQEAKREKAKERKANKGKSTSMFGFNFSY